MNVNKVILVGRLTRDPEIRTTPGGQSVATIALATNSFWTDKGGNRQDKTEYHNIVLWGKLAEIAGQYLIKGQECYVEGRLQTRAYTAKDGSEKRVTEVIGESMQMGSKAAGQGGGGTGGQGGGGYERKAPGTNTMSAGAQPKSAPAPQAEEEIPTINLDDEGVDEIRIEDVPF
jgi:single-strand DNA-binding protein